MPRIKTPRNAALALGAVLFACGLLLTTAASGSDFHSPRTSALGGSGRAGPMLNDTIYLNPSFGSFAPTYSLALTGSYFRGPATEPDGSSFVHGKTQNVSIQDGRSELFQAGMGYTRTETGSMIHLGASRSFVKRFGFGLGGKMIIPRDRSQPTVRDSTLSASAIASAWLQVVMVVDNLFESGASQGLLREYKLGTKINVGGIFLVYFDPHLVPSLSATSSIFGHETGLEFVVMSDMFLRFGAFRNAWIPFQGQRGQGYSTGLGWIGPRMSFDWGMTRVLSPSSATAHTFGTTFYF